MNLGDYLRDYIGQIVCFKVVDEVFPAWQKNRERYLYTGVITDQNIREVLPDEIVLEFDVIDTNDKTSNIVKQKARHYIELCAKDLDARRIGYHVTDHQGISPHLRTRILGLDVYPVQQRIAYKRAYVTDLLERVGFTENPLIQPDMSLLTSRHKLVSLENAPHFKRVHNGNTENIISENHNEYSRASLRLLNPQLSMSVTPTKPRLGRPSFSANSTIDLQRLCEVFPRWYAKGRRHYVLMALAGFFVNHGLSHDEALDITKTLLALPGIEPRENNEDSIDIRNAYMYRSEHKPGGMLAIGLGNEQMTITAFKEFANCFVRNDA